MASSGGVRWSEDVHQADWIAQRLAPWGDGALPVTAVVPAGFESYARVLHPAGEYQDGDRPVRWAEVAAWSGLPLYRTAQFHSVALPPSARPDPVPFSAGPSVGTLDFDDAAALAGLLRGWTATPEDCWFCVWDGFGWLNGRDGQRVRLPGRDYLLYRGAVEAVTALADAAQTANLWWPADRAWCVATEIDLRCTYVGGPADLIAALCADSGVEALPARPDDPVSLVLEDWVAAWVDDLTNALLAEGAATLTTSRGTVRAWLTQRPRPGTARLRIATGTEGGGSTSESYPRSDDPQALRRAVALQLTLAIVGLAPQ